MDGDLDSVAVRLERLLEAHGVLFMPVHTIADVVVSDADRRVFRADHELHLTSTEFDLLRAFVRHADEVLGKERLATGVFGHSVTPNAIEVHIAHLRRKLETAGPRLIHTVRGAGYVLRTDPRPAHSVDGQDPTPSTEGTAAPVEDGMTNDEAEPWIGEL
jgi:DNA-binding response OmpR family regulator